MDRGTCLISLCVAVLMYTTWVSDPRIDLKWLWQNSSAHE